jgi:hypothetical protein
MQDAVLHTEHCSDFRASYLKETFHNLEYIPVYANKSKNKTLTIKII